MEMASSSGSRLPSCLITLVFLQLPVHASGDASKFHVAPLGGTAELLCPVSLWGVTAAPAVTWLRSAPPGRSQAVHVSRDGQDREEDVMPQYQGRTALVRDAQEGSVTLEIRDVRLEDRGPYRCQVQIGNLSREGTVTLQVAVLGSDPYIHVKGFDAGWIQLVCRTVGWFPKPWAQWRDPEGRVLPSLSEAHSLDEAGLFATAVSSAVTDSTLGNVSCTIRNVALRQEKTTAMVIAAPSPGKISSSAVALAVILPLLGLLIMVGICLIWKQRRSKEKLLYEQVVEVENLLSDHAKEKGSLHKALKKLRKELKLKRAAANSGWRRARLHFVAVTLDPDTAHPKLILSDDRRCVKLGDRRQPVPESPQRFDFVVSVLGSEYFTAGCHYWEVYVGDKTKWILGVCSESVSRKGKVTASPANGHWLVRQSRRNEYEALTSPQTSFRLKEPPRCVGVFLDYEAGVISFYNVTDKSHIFTFTHTFSGPLHPFFEPCLHDEGKNTAPLIICSELQELEESTVPKPEEKGHANGDVALRVDPSLLPPQTPELLPLRDLILPWPSDLGPALQGLNAPSF
ncbi:PREDICTED: erythroid membrane-associated protein [Ceratotherium simum simum]|uniref:Erythroid membrane-associated protein n=1 Tax=Ceratotherium simum simum TaxID=73337 RepID=A0ABM1DM36_CERSS|nr:PREDICTED: erythroid membrane-associated protein [Ceratotherium simum simum]